MGQIAVDGRRGFRTESGLPCMQTLRHWRALNRDVTCRSAENKDITKLAAENYDHVASFSEALSNVEKDFSGIFKDPDRLWNIDETAVSCEFGRKVKVFGPSATHHGGYKASTAAKMNKHITAVVAFSASGRKTPLFYRFRHVCDAKLDLTLTTSRINRKESGIGLAD